MLDFTPLVILEVRSHDTVVAEELEWMFHRL
jgi:hypothetical protein